MTEKRKQPQPVAVCTKCGAYSRRVEVINQQCSERPGGKRCKGVWGSALNYNDWAECPTCEATGREAGNRCSQCDGFGWIYVRRSP